MFREVVQAMDTGVLGQIGLFAFILAFVLISVRVALLSKKEREEAKRLPLEEPPEFDPNTT